MDFDEYAEHIYQKHRLYVAIAVLKVKPPCLTSTEFLQQLKSKMAGNMADDDVTVCSDDFMMDYDDDDSVNILNNFDVELFDDLNQQNITDGQLSINIPIPSQTTSNTQIATINYQNNLDLCIPLSNPTTGNNSTYYETNQNIHSFNNEMTPNNDININNIDDLNKIGNARAGINTTEPNIETNLNGNATLTLNNVVMNQSNINIKEATETLNRLTATLNRPTASLNQSITNTDSQKTILYTVHGFTQNYTQYSPSQADIVVAKNLLYGNKNDKTANNCDINVNKKIHLKNNDLLNENTNNINKKSKRLNEDVSLTEDRELEIIQASTYSQEFDNILNLNGVENLLNTNSNNEQTNTKNKDTQFNNNPNSNIEETLNITNTNKFNKNNNINNNKNNYLDTALDNNETVKEKHVFSEENNNEKAVFSQENNEEEFDLNADTVEIVPYKVLEELNKVKSYLRRRDRRMSCDGYSTDSGYRSDSQRSSNRSALQLSGISINQSAYCLFNYIMRCPLVHATTDITTEIAMTLGQLIDRLHEEETYPPFLEEFLETTDILLRQLYKGQNMDDSEFLKKEEFIQRLLFLNRSIHIQEHTIEKITDILTTFHKKVTDENVTYELTNIDEMENSSYLFHLLELLLKKYIQNKDYSHSNTQPSQEEKIFKKSSITDIWRKKWNPNLKTIEGSRENRCVLKKCSEILNKIVVECVSLYSVVAFAALKCFNCIQS